MSPRGTGISRLRLRSLGSMGKKAAVDEDGRLAVVRVLLVIIGPANELAVVPLARADFDAEGQAVNKKTNKETKNKNTKQKDPCGGGVRAIAEVAGLRHGFV